jgi:ATP/maltotriose-dependent transcriptional regulator MalT
MVLTAPPGMGKTTLLFHLLESLRGRARTAFIFNTQCDSGEFCSYLVRDLGLSPGSDLASIHEQLNQALVFEALRGISAGDPEVRIPEESEVELCSKLKYMMNQKRPTVLCI